MAQKCKGLQVDFALEPTVLQEGPYFLSGREANSQGKRRGGSRQVLNSQYSKARLWGSAQFSSIPGIHRLCLTLLRYLRQ